MDNWNEFFLKELNKKSIKNLVRKIEEDYDNCVVYPAKKDLLNAFKLTKYQDVKAVIVGQDPYHNPQQAMGLSFSIPVGIVNPPSLNNIFKEYQSDLGYSFPSSGDLTKWAQNGVLLINSILTVKNEEAFSCNYKEYKILFEDIINFLNEREQPMVFILWGKPAQACEKYIDANKHLILMAPHPSPLSSYRGFFGSKPMSKANEFLISKGIKPIDWKL